jgi:hypothetical protein
MPASRTPRHPARRTRPLLVAVAALAAALATVLATALATVSPAQAANKATPRHFTGYGFDQCLAPSQSAMDAWLTSSPFWAVGIYISGDSRACRSQPNLTPSWISTQLRNGWRLLPITLGPQASCNARFPRYGDDERINPSTANNYAAARGQGRREAVDAMATAGRLGIVPGSTLWYDMEAYDLGHTTCRESALHFTSAWTKKLHANGYVSGVYSSAASGIRALDDARVNRPGTFALPDQIWIARWDEVANTSTSYLRSDGWLPGGRMKQYRGDHYETHGGVTINIDSNWLDLGKGSVAPAEPTHCGGVRLNHKSYPDLGTGDAHPKVSAAQCLLTQRGYYSGPISGVMDTATGNAVKAFRAAHGFAAGRYVGSGVWTALHTRGAPKLLKFGSAAERVRRLQRALNSADAEQLTVTGTFEGATAAAVRRYQARVRLPQTGVVTTKMWTLLQAGKG